MTGSNAPQFDFDALYRGESPAEGVPPITTPPWDTKAPKENVIAWHEAGLIHGEVLDIGCGLGDNAVYLAQQGYSVTGLDISPTALITAERRAADAGVDVRFAVADATKLDGYTDAFDTVIDSGMYHCLDDDGKRAYASAAQQRRSDVLAASGKPPVIATACAYRHLDGTPGVRRGQWHDFHTVARPRFHVHARRL